MKNFMTIFKFELFELMKTKSYKIITAIFLVVAIVGLSIPSIFPSLLESEESNVVESYDDEATFALYDENNSIDSEAVFGMMFPNATLEHVTSEAKVESMVKDGDVDAGFYVKDALTFEYYVNNTDLTDMRPFVFSEALKLNYQTQLLSDLGVNGEEAIQVAMAQATYETHSFGSDGANNIITVFILIMAIYMIVILYGNSIATNVATEKGNRTMELLVTSAKPTALIFGKVLASCLAIIIQVGVLLVSAKVTYEMNADAWKGMLDMVFNVPADVFIAFIVFGILGFIFYAFIFGALGALVSKSEDVNSTSMPITLIFIVVYLIAYLGVMDAASPLFTVASFVPFASPMVMFARMAMVNVPLIEVIISLVILVLSTILVGVIASKIYRRATLMYGNQIKIMHALKWAMKKEK